ncbi:hypothetical protein L1987_86657 [Smallanthus sonchifolius]|uniref:Uncharacterized protein n=1 Tax=Smallanthus sonchifolius TaxID=185202 RepID=A0ACB8Y0F4_9ASTR|nr:hypothetical protein L1987_86657 [Smallanthus sonchifolius]
MNHIQDQDYYHNHFYNFILIKRLNNHHHIRLDQSKSHSVLSNFAPETLPLELNGTFKSQSNLDEVEDATADATETACYRVAAAASAAGTVVGFGFWLDRRAVEGAVEIWLCRRRWHYRNWVCKRDIFSISCHWITSSNCWPGIKIASLLEGLAVIAFVGGNEPEETEKCMHLMWQVVHPKLGPNDKSRLVIKISTIKESDWLNFETSALVLQPVEYLVSGYLGDAVLAEELARYLDLKKSDERAYTFEGVSCYNGQNQRDYNIR